MFLLAGETLPPLHCAGFASVLPELTVEELLDDMKYCQPQGREPSTTALRVGAGLQPSGRAMPQLLPDGLGPLDHIKVALANVHPLARPLSVPVWCNIAFDAQKKGISNIKVLRRKVMELLDELATLCWSQSKIIADHCHDWIRPTVSQRNVAFMREVTYMCLGLDSNFMVDFVFGLPMMGWARHSPVMQQRESNVSRARRPSPEEVLAENRIALERAKPSRDPRVDELAWDKTKAEFEKKDNERTILCALRSTWHVA